MIVEELKKSILNTILFKNTCNESKSLATDLLKKINDARNDSIKLGNSKDKKLEKIQDSEKTKPIPENWLWVRFNNLYNFIDYRGKTPKKMNNGIRLIGSANIKMGYLDFSTEDKYISQKEYDTRKSRGITKKGDLLFITEGGSMGNICINTFDGECSCGQRVITFQQYANNSLVNKYYMFLFMSDFFKAKLKEKSTGSAAVGIKADKLKEFAVPLPPLEEQQRIVDKIEELFAELDELKSIENELEVLKNKFPSDMKKSILDYAMHGNLVEGISKENWSTESEYNIFQPLWSVTIWDKKFKEVEKNHQQKVLKYNYLLAADMQKLAIDSGDVYLLSTGNFEGWTTEEKAGKNLTCGEIVAIPWGGSPNVKYYKGKFVTSDNRIATSIDVNILNNKYLYYYMLSKLNYLDTIYRGTSLRHPSMKAVLDMMIPLPPLEEQQRIVDKLEQLLPLCDDIEKLIN